MSRPGGQMRRSMNQGGENPEFVIRDFTHGVHNFAAREAINDEEFWWAENVMPLAAGNFANVPATSAALATSVTEANHLPAFACGFNINGTPYAFAAFASGNAYIVNLNTNVVTQIIAGLLSAQGMTYATQYGNLGLLIIDPAGFWDYNVTTPNTLTPWNNTLTGTSTILGTSVAGGTQLKHTTADSGSGTISYNLNYQVISAIINAAGAGYIVGDTLFLTDNNPTSSAQIVVTAVGGGGAITGISLVTGGSYPGPTSSALAATGPSGTVVTGGSGAGATFTIKIQAIDINLGPNVIIAGGTAGFTITSPGHGWSTMQQQDETGAAVIITRYSLLISGVIGGTSIATYAGRVWIGSGRTIYFTEVGSYNNFGGSGSFFTITDAYLYNKVTVLFSINNYLYIFGPTSIDVLSNVTVTAGVTSFSRINIAQGVGTSSPASVFGYYRGLCFYDPSGFYILTGAAPEKLSEKITNIVGANYLAQQNLVGNLVYGGVLNFRQELCACFGFTLNDTVSQPGVKRSIIAIYFRKRWWLYSTGVTSPVNIAAPVISVVSPLTNLPTLYTIGQVSGSTWGVYQPLGGANYAAWQLKTKFWDAHAPFNIKQAINGVIGAVFTGQVASGITVTVDTELNSSAAVALPVQNSANAYQLIAQQVNEGGGQYIGLTFNGNGTDTSQLNILALRARQEGSLIE
jgi:hypothetical protein